MNNCQHKSCKAGALTGLSLILVLFLPLSWVHAQEEDDDDDIFELSPFNVSGDEAVGYQANSTLAGSRLDTKLRDVGTSIQVITEEFLEDTAATNARELLVYTTNTEVAGLGGNFANPVDTGGFLDFSRARDNPNAQTRVRGLAEADLTREFFLSDIPFDTYNTERITINRGANSILFGLGSPGGILNNQLKRAVFAEDLNKIKVQLDSRESRRFEFDFNRKLGEDNKVAVRVMGLYDEKEWKQRFTFDRNERINVDLAYNPFENTVFRVNWEGGRVRANRPDISTPLSNIPAWIEAGMPAGPDFWDPRPENPPEISDFRYRADNRGGEGSPVVFMGVNVRTSHIFPDPNSSEPAPIGFQAMNVPNMRDDASFPAYTTFQRRGLGTGRFQRDAALADDEIFDFRNEKLSGPSNRQNEDFSAFNVSYDQTFLENKIGFEFVYDYQEFEREIVDETSGARFGHSIDIDINPYHIDGRKNDNFLRPMTIFGQGSQERFDRDRESFQGTVFFKHDFTEQRGWLSWLGDHTITGLFKNQTIDDREREYIDAGIGDRAADFLVRSFSDRITVNRRNVNRTHFLGPPITDPNEAHAQGITVPSRAPGQIRTMIWNPETQQFEDQTFPVLRMLPTGGELSRENIDSYAGILQSRFLKDHVVFTAGIRKDDATRFLNANPEETDDGRSLLDQMALPDEPTGKVSSTSFSWGVVGHLPGIIKDRLPYGMDLSFHFSESENFQPEAGRIDVFGRDIGAPSGDTEEIGFTAEFLEGKASIRVNWFESQVSNADEEGLQGPITWVGLLPTNVLGDMEQTIEAGLNPPEFRESFTLPPQEIIDTFNIDIERDPETNRITNASFNQPSNVTGTTSFVAEGLEIEGVFNLLPNWSLLFNISRQETVRSNTGQAVEEFVDLRLPVWEANAEFWQDARANIMVLPNARRRILDPLRTLTLLDGSIAPEQREWRANLVTNYKFNEGLLKGVGIGGAARWEDSAAIGFPTTFNEELQDEVLDVFNPFFGPTEFKLDLWASYERKLFDRLDWKIQLNVVNALNDDDLVPVGQDPDGTIAGFRIQDPIRFQITNTFRF